MWLASVLALSWCGSSCRKGSQHAVALSVAHLSAQHCPAISHGLYKLHADLKRDPLVSPANDLLGDESKAAPDCPRLSPPLPPTWMCVHPPQQDKIISQGVVWRGHWANDCNEEYRLVRASSNEPAPNT